MHKHFIDLKDIETKDLRAILNCARQVKSNPLDYSKTMHQKSLGLLFEKRSLRTKISFTMAMKKMGGSVIELDGPSIGFGSRESDSDLLHSLSQYLDGLVIRNDDHDKIKQLSGFNYMPIINGLSNLSHPCQILSDILTIEELKGKIDDQLITWCGDINNVCTSLLQAAQVFGFKLNVSAPASILKDKEALLNVYNSGNIANIVDPVSAMKGADCVMTDRWVSMGEKSSKQKILLMQGYQINTQLMRHAKEDAIFMHCLPAHRNQEVTDEVIDSKSSVVWQQALNRMYVQQGILQFVLTG